MLVTHLSNIRYLCGFTGSAGALAVAEGKRPRLFTDGRYKQQAKEEAQGVSVVMAKGAATAEALKWLSLKCADGKIGFESEHVSVFLKASLSKIAGGRARPISGAVESLRMVKEPAEVEQMRAAAALASSVFDAIVPDIKPGVAENRIAAEIEYMCRRMGAEGMAFDTLVSAGLRSALPHGRASAALLPAQGFVILDFGVILGGYCSDMTRTVHLGRPDKRARSMYQAVLDSQKAGIKTVKPGIEASEVDYSARKVLEKARLSKYFTHSTGHGVGLEIHELPGLRKRSKSVKGKPTPQAILAPGMVVTIEPGVYVPGTGGVRIEDMVVVTETGCEVLTPTRKDLIVIQ